MEVLFINFNYIDMLNQFLTNIFIFKNNLNNLHFNIKGSDASSFHVSLNDDINSINLIYDSLAELIKKIGGYPIMNLEEINNISTIKNLNSQDYHVSDAKKILLKDLILLNNMNKQVGEYAFKKGDLDSINFVLNFNKYLSKKIWLLKMDNI